jgi:hypothetical protein
MKTKNTEKERKTIVSGPARCAGAAGVQQYLHAMKEKETKRKKNSRTQLL